MLVKLFKFWLYLSISVIVVMAFAGKAFANGENDMFPPTTTIAPTTTTTTIAPTTTTTVAPTTTVPAPTTTVAPATTTTTTAPVPGPVPPAPTTTIGLGSESEPVAELAYAVQLDCTAGALTVTVTNSGDADGGTAIRAEAAGFAQLILVPKGQTVVVMVDLGPRHEETKVTVTADEGFGPVWTGSAWVDCSLAALLGSQSEPNCTETETTVETTGSASEPTKGGTPWLTVGLAGLAGLSGGWLLRRRGENAFDEEVVEEGEAGDEEVA